jgi:hypothetical protein
LKITCLDFEIIISIQLYVDGSCLDEPGDVTEAFAQHFYTTYIPIPPPLSPISVFYCDSLPLIPVSDFDIRKAVKSLGPTRSVRLGDVPGFIAKGCSTILLPVFNRLKTKRMFYIWTQCVPRCKHSPLRL